MENTGSLLFDNTNARYFLIVGGTDFGPLTAEEIFEKVEKNEAGLMDFIWRPGWTDFKRIADEKEFHVLLPKKPSLDVIGALQLKIMERSKAKIKDAPPAAPTEVSYYLYFNKTQYGPFSTAELDRVISANKIDSGAFIWVPGWANWKPITEMSEFAARVKTESKESTKSKASRKDKRGSPRKPLVARLFVSNDADVIVAVCRDISVGGMQVLTDKVPGQVGAKIKLNVSPGDSKNVKGFVAEGEIVRVLEDGRGFAFRFVKISSDAKKVIEKYVS